mmetsp:Transcript_36229/g.117121  ORF Transcript_36229/g.117121 Transcript_36229/m.117121 type:complete len:743 (-) Transcript_36229:10-2238(-)
MPDKTGWTWSLFLPGVLRMILADGDLERLNALLDVAIDGFRNSGGAPVGLYEMLVDEASLVVRFHDVAEVALARLADVSLASSSFPSESALAYFQRFRVLLAFEQLGGLVSGIAEYEREPSLFSSVPRVSVGKVRSGDRMGDLVELVIPPGTPRRGSDPKPKSKLVEGSFALLVPEELMSSELWGEQGGMRGEASPWKHPEAWLARVSKVQSSDSNDGLFAKVRRISHLSQDQSGIEVGREYGLFVIYSIVSSLRMEVALRCLCQAIVPVWHRAFSSTRDAYTFSDTIRGILLGTAEHARELSARQLPGLELRAQRIVANLSKSKTFSKLTQRQQVAVFRAIVLPLSIIQGPPGTGKTTVSTAIVAAWLADPDRSGERILVVADSNVAVDNVHERLLEVGISSARVGYGKDDTIDDARVVCATCIGTGAAFIMNPSVGHFTRILVDECSQACELAVLVALGHSCEQVVVIGDCGQLPATIVSESARERGLGVSLFERLVTAHGIPSLLLMEQRRMHSSIVEWPNQSFYSSNLVSPIDDSTFDLVPGFPWPQPDCRVCFVDTSLLGGKEELLGFSSFNVMEADVVAQIVHNILNQDFDPEDLVVLTPYRAQRRELMRAIAERDSDEILDRMSVSTIDGYQGMERELVIFSATRSNDQQNIGFLSDARRMNVMLTRARRGVIVIGDMNTLSAAPRESSRWPEWIDWVKQKQSVLWCSPTDDGAIKLVRAPPKASKTKKRSTKKS